METGDYGRQIRRVSYSIQNVIESTVWRISPEASNVRSELLNILDNVNINPDTPPQVLQVDVNGRKYVSVRRKEGADILEFHDLKDLSKAEAVFGIDVSKIYDNYILLLIVPEDAKIINKELEEKFPRDYENWSWFGDTMLYEEYRPEDWKISHGVITLAKKVGNNFYFLDRNSVDKYDMRPIVRLIHPKDNNLELYRSHRSLSDREWQVKKGWYETKSRLYLLVEGKAESGGVKNLKSLVLKRAESYEEPF